jgi:DNA-binding XRE family transcriptional regulator
MVRRKALAGRACTGSPSRKRPRSASNSRAVGYLGYDPFNDPTLGSPKGNEPSCVAFLSLDAPLTIGQKIKQSRLKLRKTRKQLASEWGISVKTLWGWETNRWQPSTLLREQIGVELSL